LAIVPSSHPRGAPAGAVRPEPPPHVDGLSGHTDGAVAALEGLRRAALDELASVARELARTSIGLPTGAAPAPPAEVARILATPIGDLDLAPQGRLERALGALRAELQRKGISWFPGFYLGDSDFWTTDQATSVNVPWFLADDALWWLVNEQTTRYTEDELLMVLRHEAAHAVGYAFELWRRPDWERTFGDFLQPYRDAFDPDPSSTDFVRHLHRSGANANAHYAQKHPDEDWAETFAVWLSDPEWRRSYEGWHGALAKLAYVERLVEVEGAAYGRPRNTSPGRREPYQQIRRTVGEHLGLAAQGEWHPGPALRRRAGELAAEARLRGVHLAGVRRGAGIGAGPLPLLAQAMAEARGSVDAFMAELRACLLSGAPFAAAAWDGPAGLLALPVGPGGAGLPPGASPVLACPVSDREAALGDFGGRRDLLAAAWLRNVDWVAAEERLRAARGLDRRPTAAQALYVPPNPDGTGKSCSSCYLFDGTDRCGIHAELVGPGMVCGYHLYGIPGPDALRPRALAISPALSGLSAAPAGGTSCSGCRHSVPDAAGATCDFVVGGDGAPLRVERLACCAAWEAR
jgi:hypothetical protein